MTNTQNLTAIIMKLIEEEQKQKTAYEEAEAQKEKLYQKMLKLELLYNSSYEDEIIGIQLDEVCDKYEKAYEEAEKEDERLEAIQEAIEHLRKASGILKWFKS